MWRSLEPASLLVNLIPTVWRTARSLWPLILAMVIGGSVQGFIDFGFLGLFLFLAVARTVMHYVTLRYRLYAGKLEIRSGLIGRRHRIIDPTRIQNIEIVQNMFHRMAGLVELRLETAGEAGVDGLLSAISVEDATALREQLSSARSGSGQGGASSPEAAAEEAGRVELLELVGYGLSSGRIGAAILIFGIVSELLGQLGQDRANDVLSNAGPTSWLGLLLIGVAFAYVSAVGNALLRFYGFRLLRGPRGIATVAGLFTQRRVEIPPRKVQVLRVDEPALRRLMGYATVQIETAGSGMPGEPGSADAMIPMVPVDDVDRTLSMVLPGLPSPLFAARLSPAAPRALVRALTSATLRWGVVIAGLSRLGGGPWWLLLWVYAWVAAWLDWRSQGWHVDDRVIVSRRGFPTRHTWILLREKMQSVHHEQGPLMRLNHLGRVSVWVAGTRVELPDLREAEAQGLYESLSRWDTGGDTAGGARR